MADEYEEKGYNIVTDALESPLTRIVENAIGDGEGKAVVRKVQDAANKTAGYNALKRLYEDDMFVAGIIDPGESCAWWSAACSLHGRYFPDH